jgi:SAM-dependent methyltransferase
LENRFVIDFCPNCGARNPRVFYSADQVPAHSVLLMNTREQALAYPRGRIDLGFCDACGFISNLSFDPALNEYSSQYEETQGFSPTFNAFHRRLADDLIRRYDLHGKDVLEIGCGKGEFLALLCERGSNRGVGFDPSFLESRAPVPAAGSVLFIRDFYSRKYADYRADFICCKMTLEHIQDTAGFVGSVRQSIGDRRNTVVFFQIPDVTRILDEFAFWDVYYEHCSYFSPSSLGALFARSGFEVVRQWVDYGDQYLMIEARPAVPGTESSFTPDPDSVRARVDLFAAECRSRIAAWRRMIAESHAQSRRMVLWGGGSKAVAFLTTIGVGDEIPYAVDINPHKHGTFLAGSGQEIVSPEFLKQCRPDLVILMNPVYREEVGQSLREMGISAELIGVESPQEGRLHAALG